MYVILNAVKNIGRNKGRNILLGSILLVMIITTAVSMIINTTTGKIINDYKNSFGTKVSIVPDMSKMQTTNENFPPPSSKDYKSYAESQYVKEVYFSNEAPGASDELKGVGQNDDSTNKPQMVGGGGEMKMPIMKVKGVSSLTQLNEFTEETRKVIDGLIFKKDNECIVSVEFATLNGLSVNDEITIDNAMQSGSVTMKVTGIYKDLTDEYGGTPFKDAFMNKRNEIFTTFETVSSMTNSRGVNTSVTYYIDSPEHLAAFESEIRTKGLSSEYKVSADTASYNRVVAPVEGLKSITTVFMWVVLTLGCIVLILISSMAIRERKYEIGVLRAMGMKKDKLVISFLTEVLVITAICLTLGLAIGSVSAQPIADSLMKAQVAAAESAESDSTFGNIAILGGPEKDTTPTITEISVGLNASAAMDIIVIAFVLAIISSMFSIIYISKYEPIKILSERN